MAPPELASLRLTQDEADWIAAAGPLISTPRASKRLVNTYLLFRASQPAEDVQHVGHITAAEAAIVLEIGGTKVKIVFNGAKAEAKAEAPAKVEKVEPKVEAKTDKKDKKKGAEQPGIFPE